MQSFDFDSSNLEGGTYNPETQELTITFKSGRTYCYEGVSQNVVDELLNATSQGSFFSREIRNSFSGREI